MPISKAKAIEEAQKLINLGKLKEAVAEYLKIYKYDSKDQNVLNALGDLFVRLRKNQEALTYYSKLADIYVADGFLVRAIAMYKKIAKLDPSSTQAMERLADLYTMQGLVSEARAQYLQLAELHIKANATPKGIEVLQKILDLEPDNLQIHKYLADLHLRHGQKGEAAGVYRRLAEHLLAREDIKESQRWIEKAAELAPAKADVCLLQARILEKSGRGAEALKALEKIPDLAHHPEAQGVLLSARLAAGDLNAAERMAEEIFASNPKSFGGLLQLAEHALEQNDPSRALASLQRVVEPALEHDPLRLLQSARQVGKSLTDSSPALDLWIQAARQAGDANALDEALNLRGQLAVRTQELDQARQVYEELVKLAPENPDYTQRLNSVREQLGEVAPATAPPAPPEEAREFFREDVEEEIEVLVEEELDDDTRAYVNSTLNDIDLFSNYGMTDKAIELAEELVRRVPNHVVANEKLLDFYLGSGNDVGVIEVAKRLASLHRQAGSADRADEVSDLARRYSGKIGRAAATAAPPSAPRAAAEPAPRPTPTPVPEPVAAEPEPDEIDLSAEWESALGEEAPAFTPVEAEPEVPALSKLSEVRDEIEFYLSQGLFQEARQAISHHEELFPDEPLLAELRTQVEKAAAPVPPEALPAGVPLDLEGETFDVVLEEQPKESAPAAPMSAAEFFSDLAAEVGEAIRTTPKPPPPKAPPTATPKPEPAEAAGTPMEGLAQVFEEFKEELGDVEEVEDIDTHYNLGIAFKEMGLLDEAISEFQKVMKAAEKQQAFNNMIQCCSLLGLCFMDKRMPEIAVRWYERALKAPGLDAEGALALRYDMGVAHEQAGNRKAALDCFIEVYALNVDYRNVGERIKELRGSS